MNENTVLINLNTEQKLVPNGIETWRILEVHLQAPCSVSHTSRPPLNLALVLDRSGSMSGEKLEYVKLAAGHVLDLLQEQDSVAIVSFDDEIKVEAPGTRINSSSRGELKRIITRLRPGGSTNLGGGWLAGSQQAAGAAREMSINRTLLLTDGLANVGETDLETLSHQARELSRRGVSTTTFGVGIGFNEHLLEAMANQGGGNFYYIETPDEIPGLFRQEFNELAAVTASEVALEISFPERLRLHVLGGWACDFSAGRLRLALGSLYSGQAQDIYIRMLVPAGGMDVGFDVKASLSGKDESGRRFEEQAEVLYRYADQAVVTAAPLDRSVLENFAKMDLAETANEALKLERQGRNKEARIVMESTITLQSAFIAPSDAAHYRELSERMGEGMDELDRKRSHYSNYNVKRQKDQQK